MLNTEKSSLSYLKSSTIVERSSVEAGLNLSSEQKDKVVSFSGYVCHNEISVENGYVKYSGKVIFNVIFSEEEPERIETGVKFEFKKAVDDSVEKACVEYSLSDFEIKSDGGMLVATCALERTLTLYTRVNTEIVTEVDCLSKKEEVFYPKIIITTKDMELEDKLQTQKIKKVLFSSADSCVNTVKTGNNTVTVEGFSVLTLVSLPFSENSDIIKDTRVIPYKFEFDATDVSEDYISRAMVNNKDLSVKVYTDEEENKSTIETLITLEFTITSYGTEKTFCVSDAVSDSFDVSLKKSCYEYEVLTCERSVTERVLEKADVNVPEYSRFIKAVGERTILRDVSFVEGELTVNGVIESDCLFSGDNGMVFSKAKLPFTVVCDYHGDKVENVSVCLEGLQGRLRSGKLEQEATLNLTFFEYSVVKSVVLCDALEGVKTEEEVFPISVYFGKAGETEWDVVKALKVDADEIYKFNPELSFPLCGTERIIVIKREELS